MADLSALSVMLASIKTATEIAKLIRESEKSLEHAERKAQLAELISALADAKIEAASIQDEILTRDSEIRKLKDALQKKEKITWSPPYYFYNEEGPYCQNCYDQHEKLIRLQAHLNIKGLWICMACDKSFKDDDYKDPGPLNIRFS